MSWLSDQIDAMSGIGGLKKQQRNIMGDKNYLMDRGKGLLDFTDPFYGQYQGQLNRQIGDTMATGAQTLNRQMAATGVGGGIGSAIRGQMTNKSAIGEQVRTGLQDMYTQGIGMGSTLTGQGVQAGAVASDLSKQIGTQQGELFTGAVKAFSPKGVFEKFGGQLMGGAMGGMRGMFGEGTGQWLGDLAKGWGEKGGFFGQAFKSGGMDVGSGIYDWFKNRGNNPPQ